MRISRRQIRWMVGLCILVFSAQAVADVTLACMHSGDPESGREGSACPYHQGSAGQRDDPEPAPLLDCQKCALHCTVGAPSLIAAPLDVSSPPMRAVLEPPPRTRFASFSPELILKPPIPQLL